MTTDLILGTAGHIDHGKTALIRAITGTDTDRLPEEKKRGITIELGFAELTVGQYRLGVVDVPGHERFVRNMLAGATGMDLAKTLNSTGPPEAEARTRSRSAARCVRARKSGSSIVVRVGPLPSPFLL